MTEFEGYHKTYFPDFIFSNEILTKIFFTEMIICTTLDIQKFSVSDSSTPSRDKYQTTPHI